MNTYTIDAPAKINWYLNIGKKRPDGYHDIQTVMQTVPLCDTLRFAKRNDNEIRISVDGMSEGIPCNENNLIYRAAVALGVFGVDISLTKRIPSQAGLGGGSSDAASTLVALNNMFELGKSKQELVAIAARLGSDVPFFVYGGACVIGGMGEEVIPLEPVTSYRIAIIKHKAGLSTKDVFNKFDEMPMLKGVTCEEFIRLFNNENKELHKFLFNSLEPAALSLCPSIVEAKKEMEALGAVGVMMSGSGTSVFGLFNDDATYLRAVEQNKKNPDFWGL